MKEKPQLSDNRQAHLYPRPSVIQRVSKGVGCGGGEGVRELTAAVSQSAHTSPTLPALQILPLPQLKNDFFQEALLDHPSPLGVCSSI